MSQQSTNSLAQTLRWLSAHARFPAQRLPSKTERAICFAIAAACHERASDSPINRFDRRQGAVESSQRALAENRRRVHFKCDNSAKV